MPIDEEFLEGNLRRYTATFEVSGTPTDPTTVRFSFRKQGPGSSTTAYVYGVDVEVVKLSTGVYYVDLPFAESGRYTIGAKGTGACTAYAELDVNVKLGKVYA
jgi:hypothetical protein